MARRNHLLPPETPSMKAFRIRAAEYVARNGKSKFLIKRPDRNKLLASRRMGNVVT